MGLFGAGQAVRRLEDYRLLTGEGCYSDDVAAPGAARAVLVRSLHAHAEILGIDTHDAEGAPGVLGVFTAVDLAADGIGHIPCMAPVTGKGGSETIVPAHPLLAQGRVLHVGEPVVLVVAETLDQARDAAELVAVDYRELPFVIETAQAVDQASPQIWPEAPNNIAVDWETGDAAEVARAFDRAAHVTRLTLINNRIVVNPLEPRTALAEYDAKSGRFTLTTPSQGVHTIQNHLADHIFNMSKDRFHVITPDVGGGFGTRIFCCGEQMLVLWAARRLGRPVRWTADRSECFFSDPHARDHVSKAELALDDEGRFLGIRVSTVANMGAYLVNYAPHIPTEMSSEMLAGPYRMPVIHAEVKCVFTNTVPVDIYRGTGRAECTYLLESLVDAAAHDLGLTPAEIRRRNFITREELPHTTATKLTYDSGDFLAIMERAMALADWQQVERRKIAARAEGRLLGIGMASYIETAAGFLDEHAHLRLESDGGVTVSVGTQTSGQGHATVYAQLVADKLGIPLDIVRLNQGDSDVIPSGGGTFGSRSVLMGGLAIQGAADVLIEKARRIASHMMEAAESDLTFENAAFTIVGTDRRMTLAEIARAAADGTSEPGLPEELTGPLEGSHEAKQAAMTYPNGCHICELAVDPETGAVEIRRYLVVDDFGRVINPLLCASQIHGGTAQGIGQALLEHTVYESDSGQLLTGSLMDYCLPRADDLPDIEVTLVEDTPCTTNAMGVKGSGEAGALGAPAAVINALVDALAPFGIRHIDMPATPERVWRAIQDAKKA